MSGDDPAGSLPDLASGRLLAEINNRLVALMREHYGRGPVKAKTYVFDDLIVCVLRDGLTPMERAIMDASGPDRITELRREFHRAMRTRYSHVVEQLTARKVLACIVDVHFEPDLTIQTFVMDGPAPRHGALEVAHEEQTGQTT